jgi:hypothetical protein
VLLEKYGVYVFALRVVVARRKQTFWLGHFEGQEAHYADQSEEGQILQCGTISFVGLSIPL